MIKNPYAMTKKYELKPYVFPEGFILIVDTREVSPLFLKKPPKGLIIVRDTLPNFDYALKGFTEDGIIAERKGISDLSTYVGRDHDKTKAKLDRVRNHQVKMLVVEASEEDILSPQMYSDISPETVRQCLAKWSVEYNLHVYFHRSRAMLENFILTRFIWFFKMKRGIK